MLVMLTLLVPIEVLAEKGSPQGVFHCQVVTISGAQGLVSFQTYSLEDAREGVVGKTAITLLGNEDTADRVIQCIELGGDKSFSDSNFQAWFEKLAR